MSEIRQNFTAFEEIVEPRLVEIDELCSRLGVERLALFGPAVTGRLDPQRSDLDFLVLFGQLPPGRYAKACFE